MKRLVLTVSRSAALKLAVALCALGGLFWFGSVDLKVLTNLSGSYDVPLGVFFLIALTVIIAAYRWNVLLRTQAIAVGTARALNITWIATFYNMFVPGGVGGDATRILYVLPFSRGRRGAGVLSVLIDRVLGLLGLVSIGFAILLLRPDLAFGYDSGNSRALVGVSVFAAGVVALFAIPRLLVGIPGASARPGLLWRALRAAVLILRDFSAHPGSLAAGWALSMLLHVVSLGAIAALGIWSGIGHLDWAGYALAGAVSMLANVLPLTPGGIGVGELAFAYVCRLISGDGVSPFATILFLFRALTALVSLYGAVVFVFYRNTGSAPDKAAPLT
ncbi:MAG: flippase-like domain-containing protein [Hyphomicrobiales bacterium]|nr:flippase-like domain-containing protein [Acidobacteriaceae bacterium]MBV9978370.1 flippase-like domain-containing protein [Hyphomicrobiales bacterium]